MYRVFERFTKPFPEQEVGQPPHGLLAFCRFYTKGMELPLLFMSLSAALLAILEVTLFGFMGDLVDWLSTYTPQTLFEAKQTELIRMSVITLVALPLLVFFHSAILHQSLLGNYQWLFAGRHTATC